MSTWTLPSQPSGMFVDLSPLAFWVCVPGKVLSKSNYRNGSGAAARQGWKAVHTYEDNLSLLVRASRPSGWKVPSMDLALSQRPVTVAALVARTTLDTGNISKSILDACQLVLVGNDAEFKAVMEVAERTRKDQGVVAAFDQLPPLTSAQDAATRTWQLVQNVLDLSA